MVVVPVSMLIKCYLENVDHLNWLLLSPSVGSIEYWDRCFTSKWYGRTRTKFQFPTISSLFIVLVYIKSYYHIQISSISCCIIR